MDYTTNTVIEKINSDEVIIFGVAMMFVMILIALYIDLYCN